MPLWVDKEHSLTKLTHMQLLSGAASAQGLVKKKTGNCHNQFCQGVLLSKACCVSTNTQTHEQKQRTFRQDNPACKRLACSP